MIEDDCCERKEEFPTTWPGAVSNFVVAACVTGIVAVVFQAITGRIW